MALPRPRLRATGATKARLAVVAVAAAAPPALADDAGVVAA